MKKARIAKRMTFRELSTQTGIRLSRLCDLEQGRAEPTSVEVDKIAMVLGSKIKFAESEEAKKKAAALDAQISAINKVYEEVESRGLGKGRGGCGTMPCPKCSHGDIDFKVHAINGHVWARCTTDGCLAWMQ